MIKLWFHISRADVTIINLRIHHYGNNRRNVWREDGHNGYYKDIITNTITSTDYGYNESDDRVLSLYIYILEADGNYAKDYSSFASDHHYYHHKVDHDYVDRHRGLVWQ